MGDICQAGILFADISGSTRIYEVLGDQHAHAVVSQTVQICADVVGVHGGKVVKTIGDELMAAFAAPKPTLDAAIAIQQRIDKMPMLVTPAGNISIAMRIGLHFGAAVREDGDFFGDSVNVAARMVGLAKAAQIMTTGDVVEALPVADRARAKSLGMIDVKGRAALVGIAQVEWSLQPGNVTVLELVNASQPAQRDASLRLVFDGRTFRVPRTVMKLACGREPASDFVLKGPLGSRAHATIEQRRGKFFLVDHSTNGTWLMLDGQAPIRLHREEFALLKQGCIVFGQLDKEESDTLWFYFD